MTDPFHSPKRRFARAIKDFRDLDRRIKKFFNQNPYVRLVEPDPDGVHQVHKIKLTKALPDRLTDLTYDVIDGLRSSLDQSVYAIAVVSKMGRPDRVHFPIADTAADFENALAGNCKGLRPEILALLRGFNPYEGGNDVIWALNRIRRQGYHRLIVPVGTATAAVNIRRMQISGSGSIPAPRWDSEKNEIVFLRTSPDSKADYNLQFAFFVAFGEVEGVAGEPILGFLSAAGNEVQRIGAAIEAEARRIGLIA